MKTIYDRIKDIADQNEMPISELERKSDIGSGTIRRWSDSIPSADKLQRVAKVLNVDMEYLLNGTQSEDELSIIARELISLSEDQKQAILNIIEQFKK